MRKILVLIILIVSGLPAAAQSLLISDIPDWVDVVDIPTMDPELYQYVEGGENYLLVDRQVRWIGTVRETYIRVVTEAVNRSGLETIATVSRDFDPAIDTLTMVRLDTIRDGVRTDQRDRVTVDLIRRETRLEQGILDGTLTAYMSVPSVIVGDSVDAAFIWRTEEYFPGYNFAARYQMEYSIPIAMNRVVVNWPDDRAVEFSDAPQELNSSIERNGEFTRYEWIALNQNPQLIDSATPAEYDPWTAIEFSGIKSWNDVSASLAEFYTRPLFVPEMWRDKVNNIAETQASPEARAFAALRLIQDEIRYVGVEVGAGGYFARSPETVVANAYGDCKDKAQLLKIILNDLGVEASVALASLQTGYGVVDRLPSTQPFDHMIVGAELAGGTFWMDPTASYQGGGVNSAVEPDYGYVLPLDNRGRGLVEIGANNKPRHSREMTESFWFTFAGAILTVETEFKGESANWQREYWAATSVENIAIDYLSYYARNYPGIQTVMPPIVDDNRETNVIKISESYLIPQVKLRDFGQLAEFPFISANSYDGYPDLLIGERRDPLAVQHSQNLVHKIQVRNAPIDFEAPGDSEITGPAFAQNFSARSWDGGNMDLIWSYQSRSRSVAAKDVGRVIQDAKAARGSSAFSWDLRAGRNEG